MEVTVFPIKNLSKPLANFVSKKVLALLAILLPLSISAQDLDVPYVPTPEPVVKRMLDMTRVEAGDYVIDLGSGDGRIVIAAAKRGAAGHGIDLDPKRIKEARTNARKQGVTRRVVFIQENIFKTDFRMASVITMYLLPSVNMKLRSQLLDELEPGTRIVSHSFDMDEWKPDKKETMEVDGGTHDIYYWVIPAKTKGTWEWKVDNKNFDLTVKQQFQEIDLQLNSGNRTWKINDAVLQGKRIGFTATSGDIHYVFSGSVEKNSIRGTVQIHEGERKRLASWSAQRN